MLLKELNSITTSRVDWPICLLTWLDVNTAVRRMQVLLSFHCEPKAHCSKSVTTVPYSTCTVSSASEQSIALTGLTVYSSSSCFRLYPSLAWKEAECPEGAINSRTCLQWCLQCRWLQLTAVCACFWMDLCATLQHIQWCGIDSETFCVEEPVLYNCNLFITAH